MITHVLGLEGATGTASLAVVRADGELLAEVSFVAKRTLAQRLVPMLDLLLKSIDLPPTAIDALAVGLGPGSFTSLRVVLATAKGLALAGDLPVLGIGSLETLAAGAPLEARRPVCALIPAPKRHVYAGLYGRLSDERSNCLFGPELLPTEELAARLASVGHDVALVGQVSEADRAILASAPCHFLPPLYSAPRAAVTAQLALRRLLAGERHATASLTPLYVHPSEPEVRFGAVFARSGPPGEAISPAEMLDRR